MEKGISREHLFRDRRAATVAWGRLNTGMVTLMRGGFILISLTLRIFDGRENE
jgi:hypothetical protein